MLNSGHKLELLKKEQLETIWEAIFFALWYAEMGKGCEDIIAATVRGCKNRYEFTRLGFKEIAKTWFGLDQHRVDKVSHLARHLTARLIQIQIKMWFEAKRKVDGESRKPCKPIVFAMLNDIQNSIGLLYFVLSIFVEEFKRALDVVYAKMNIYTGHSELKTEILSFVYKQFFMFIVVQKYDFRLVSTVDINVFQEFLTNQLANESQLTQIHATLKFKKILDRYTEGKKSKSFTINRKTELTMCRWSDMVSSIHDSCISGQYFTDCLIPKPVKIKIPKETRFSR